MVDNYLSYTNEEEQHYESQELQPSFYHKQLAFAFDVENCYLVALLPKAFGGIEVVKINTFDFKIPDEVSMLSYLLENLDKVLSEEVIFELKKIIWLDLKREADIMMKAMEEVSAERYEDLLKDLEEAGLNK